ncbi:hypothetical protein HYU21_05100 [Candidatus Woesearchaeota archaeon]|nr:hypothetical protein [Candidatus Woesearchaeota archaeon]
MVSVHLDINGKLLKDIPKYSGDWKVFVSKNGLIDNKWDYLFYEAQ